jgi:hypothetical protein
MMSICIGVYICHRTAKDMGTHDHGSIVWDEFVGMWITLMALPTLDWQWVAAGFVIFRIFDMWKPWPIRWFDRNIHGGMGIMVDDIVAGVISAGVLYVIGHHWPLVFLNTVLRSAHGKSSRQAFSGRCCAPVGLPAAGVGEPVARLSAARAGNRQEPRVT